MTPEPWGPERVSELADLVAAALPGEPLIEDELEPCWSERSAVLGHEDGAVVAHAGGGHGWVDLLVVRPERRRQRLGSALLGAATDWLRAAGAASVELGGSAPWYLWPGVEESNHAMLALAEAAGFRRRDEQRHNLVVDTLVRVPADGEVRRLDDTDLAALARLVGADRPGWVDELGRGVAHGTCFGTGDRAGLLAAGAHSVNRLGWIGPMYTAREARGSGRGAAVLHALRRDLAAAGYRRADVAWVGPDRFYERAAGARPGRRFAVLERAPTPDA